MNSEYEHISNIIRSYVEKVLGRKATNEQIEEISQSVFLIIKKHQNYLIHQFNSANQITYFPNQQKTIYPFTINIFLQLNGLNNGSIFSTFNSNSTNGFIPNYNYQNIPQTTMTSPTIPLIPFPNISTLPPLCVHKHKKIKKEKSPDKSSSSSTNHKKKSKSLKDKKKAKKTSKKAKKSNLPKTTFENEPKETDDIFTPYIKPISFVIYPSLELTTSGSKLINTLLIKIYKKLAREASRIVQSERKSEMDHHHIEMAVMSLFSGDLAKFGAIEGKKAIANKNKNDWSLKSGLIYNYDIIYRLLRDSKYADSINENAAIYLSAVLEYIIVEIIEKTGYINMSERMSESISQEDINEEISKDKELFQLRSKLDI